MISKVIAWWKRRHIVWKVLSAVFVVLFLFMLVVWAFVSRRGVIGAKIVDAAAGEYQSQSDRRKEKLQRQDEEGAAQVVEANKKLEELREEGAAAKIERERRDEELRNADSWSDLDSELGTARDGGRSGTR